MLQVVGNTSAGGDWYHLSNNIKIRISIGQAGNFLAVRLAGKKYSGRKPVAVRIGSAGNILAGTFDKTKRSKLQ